MFAVGDRALVARPDSVNFGRLGTVVVLPFSTLQGQRAIIVLDGDEESGVRRSYFLHHLRRAPEGA